MSNKEIDTPRSGGYIDGVKHAIESPQDVRTAIISALDEDKQSRYGFAKACAENKLCQIHTVDAVLAPPESRTANIPTLAIALALLDAAGYDLTATRKRSGIKIGTKRKGAK